MKTQFFRFTFFLLICFALSLTATAQVISIPEPAPPPPDVRAYFNLDPYYEQWIDVKGFPVLASGKVNPYAVKEAAWQIRQMIGHRPDILQAMVQNKARFSIIPHTEIITDIPEYSSDPRPDFLIFRERGWGGSEGATVTASEEGILHYSGSYGTGYNVLIHEFAHGIHLLGLNTFDPTFEERLNTTYKTAMQRGLWSGTYASSDMREYWAEGTMGWFLLNGRGSFSHFGNTRQALKAYDPGLAALLSEVYGDTEWRYTPVTDRLNQPHLQGFDPQDSPAFVGFPELEAVFQQLRDPYSDGGGRWVDLKPYDPTLLPNLIESITFGPYTMFVLVNLSGEDVLLYKVRPNGTERYRLRLPPNWIRYTSGRVGQLLVVKDSDGKNLAVFQAEKKIGRAFITPVLHLITHGLSKVSGDNQSGVSGAALSNPFVVEARDQNLTPLEGVSVTFTVAAGGGTLSVTHTTTNANGRAESTLTLGPNFGTNTVLASAAGVAGTVTFNAVAEAMGDIPDPNLLAAVLTALNKPDNDPITPSEIATVTRIDAENAGITNLIGLEHAIHLRELHLWKNSVKDLSPLSGLTNLTGLYLGGSSASDLSPLAGLTNLESLFLDSNGISDLSPLAGLTNLTRLALGNNSVKDLSPLTGLTSLRWIRLASNNISDLSPLVANTGLGSEDEVDVRGNPLNYASIYTRIPELQSRGVTVEFDTRKVQRLLKISGDNQQGTVDAVLADPLVIEVMDERNTAFAGVPVTFTVTDGSGTVSVTSTTTDENGRAQSTLTLGPDLGQNTVLVSAAETEMQVIFNAISSPPTVEYLWSIPAGTSLIHVPLKVTAVDGVAKTITTISDLYDTLGGALTVNFLMTYDSQAQGFRTYFGVSDRGTSADVDLTDEMGILANLKTATPVRLTGDALGTGGTSTITLTSGLNLVGLPLNNSSITRVSDLFTLEGILGNVPVIILTEAGDFQSVGRAGDPWDIPITGGQGFILTAQQPATVTISGEAWTNASNSTAAPSLAGIAGRNTTPVLALKGVVVDERTGANETGFRVSVKNLSTGSAVTALTAPDEAGYRLAVVDIETGRAAAIGDTLKISAQSPNPFIGVKPLRYTITADDVKQSLIQLPELVAYEIPKETQLLANYPNPFNPETWIPYRLAEDAFVTLTIYDQGGRIVRTLEVGHRIAAVYEDRSKAIYWDGRNDVGERVASGVYFYHLSAGDYSATRRMVILK